MPGTIPPFSNRELPLQIFLSDKQIVFRFHTVSTPQLRIGVPCVDRGHSQPTLFPAGSEPQPSEGTVTGSV